MLFSSMIFLWGFLPIILVFYYGIGSIEKRWKNIILLIASILFYAWGEPIYVLIMCSSILFNYIVGILLEKMYYKKQILIADIILNFGVLVYFKYFTL